jgi:hypothetical protein
MIRERRPIPCRHFNVCLVQQRAGAQAYRHSLPSQFALRDPMQFSVQLAEKSIGS